ncbi:hypothetical protein J1614_007194 [Plenodomus biglobosus]|nr:hypothetical protein J1614_007194 [Plenodomus biglobosus]
MLTQTNHTNPSIHDIPQQGDVNQRQTTRHRRPRPLPRSRDPSTKRREQSEAIPYPSSSSSNSSYAGHNETPTGSRGRPIRQSELDELIQTARRHGDGHDPVKLPLTEDEITKAEGMITPSELDYFDHFQKYGYTAIVDAAFEEATEAKHPYTSQGHKYGDIDVWRRIGVKILASCPRVVLEGVLDGRLPLRVKANTNPDLSELFDMSKDLDKQSLWAQRESPNQPFAPSIYMRAYVNDRGLPPSRADLLRIVNLMREYISGDRKFDKQNASIDSQTRGHPNTSDIAIGAHRHLGSRTRACRIEAFSTAIEDNIYYWDQKDPESNLTVLRNPLKYFGITTHPNARAAQHSSGAVTNRIMALVVDIGKFAFRKSDNTPVYNMTGFTICHLTNTDECRLGEELFCRIGGGYYYTGRGFNVQPAGVASTGDLGQLTANTAEALWATCVAFRAQLDFFPRQYKHEIDVSLVAYRNHLEQAQRDEDAANDELDSKLLQLLESVDRLSNEQRKLQSEQTPCATLRNLLMKLSDEQAKLEEQYKTDHPLRAILHSSHVAMQATAWDKIDQLAAEEENVSRPPGASSPIL